MIIWKYELKVEERQVITMPTYARILHVAVQDGKIMMWALVQQEKPDTERYFEVFGTGRKLPEGVRVHLGTVQKGPFVWHAFERLDGKWSKHD